MPSPLSNYHSIEELLKNRQARGTLYITRKSSQTKRMISLIHMAEKAGVPVETVPNGVMDNIGPNLKHRGFLFVPVKGAKPRAKAAGELKDFLAERGDTDSMVVLLDKISDPHNLGAILRSCDQFGADCVVLPSRQSVKETETVLNTSAGAASYVPVYTVANLSQTIQLLKKNNYWIYGAHMQGQSILNTKFAPKSALVLGSEGQGLHELTKKNCDILIKIPTRGHIDSLNVSVAAGIILYEVRRQQLTG